MIKFKCHWSEIFTRTKKAKIRSTLAANAAVTQTLSPRLKEKIKDNTTDPIIT